MIEESSLSRLGEASPGPTGPDVPPRPVGEVVDRGNRLRRRRLAVRAAGAGAVAVALVAAVLLGVDGRPEAGPNVKVDHATVPPTTADVPSSPPPPPDCLGKGPVHAETLAAADVPEELRLLPSWTPGDTPVTGATGKRSVDPCPDSAPYPAEAVLQLVGPGDASIALDGPMAPRKLPVGAIAETPTRARGVDALVADPSSVDDVALYWTEPDGWAWSLTGWVVDDATLRSVAEALVLDSSPEGDEPPAYLPPEAVPAGFHVVYEAKGPVAALSPEQRTWSVEVGETPSGPNVGTTCQAEFRTREGRAPVATYGGPGSRTVTVNGQDAVLAPGDGPNGAIYWAPGPGVLAGASCFDWDGPIDAPFPADDLVRFAESFAPVASDDHRIPR